MAEKNPIKNTAFLPLVDLAKQTNVPYCKKMWNSIKEIIGDLDPVKKSYFVESRYMGSHEWVKNYSQIIELASGYMPHAYHVDCESKNSLERYIEVDFPETIKLKKETIKSSNLALSKEKHVFIGGDIYDTLTWDKVLKSIKSGVNTGIFANGFMMYTNQEQRSNLAKKLISLLDENGGSFWFEDSLTFHPEFRDHKDLRTLSEKMSKISKNKQLTSYLNQGELTQELQDLGFHVERTPAYSNLSSKDLDEEGKVVISKFKNWILSPRKK